MNNKQMLNRLYNQLPRMYRNMDLEQKKQLEKYLDIMVSGGLYPAYLETQNLMNLMDFNTVPKEYLPYLASVLGFQFPYDLDEQTQRTYIKTAVAGYKKKGTQQALAYMVRELTRFKTSIDVDRSKRQIDVTLEVDMTRQDFNRVVDKVKFLVNEYAPPHKILNIINSFLWIEEKYPFVFTDSGADDILITAPLTDYANKYHLSKPVIEEILVENISLSDLETFISAFDDLSEELSLNWADNETWVNTKTDSEVRDSITIQPLITDYFYESATWFGANNGLTNQTETFAGEIYTKSVLEDYSETITVN